MAKQSEEEKCEYSLFKTFLAEFVGTMMLLLVVGCANAALSLNPQNKDNHSTDSFGAAFSAGLGAFVGIACSFVISGGHINPAVTIAFATLGRFPWKRVVPYIVAQYLGAFVGAALTYLCYSDAIKAQNAQLNNTDLIVYGHDLSTGGIFATYPKPHVTIFGSFIDQVIGTASLLFCVMTVVDQRLDIPKSLQPFILGFVVIVNSVIFGYNVGGPLNPARDLSPRIFTSFAGWGIEVFKPLNGHYWYLGGILGPHIGAICGVWIYYIFIEYHSQPEKLPENNNNIYKTNRRENAF